jgi:hypothetical protein
LYIAPWDNLSKIILSGFFMAYDSKSYLETRLSEVRSDIAKARRTQSYAVGQDLNVARGNLKVMLDEEKWLLGEIAKADTAASGGACNRARFVKPL